MIVRGELDPDERRRLLEPRATVCSRFATTRRLRRGTARARRARRYGLPARARRLDRGRDPCGGFLLGPLSTTDGRLLRAWRDGRHRGEGYLEDYAAVAYGLLELHVATGDARWLHEAKRLASSPSRCSRDEERGGFFMAPVGGEELVARTKPLDDNPTPSGNSMLAYVLLRLGASGVTTSSSVAPCPCSASSSRRSPVSRRRSAGRCVRST